MRQPVLMLLPGLLCDEAVWRDQVAALSDKATCVVPDYGSLDSLVDMARHVLATAPAERFVLAGHSMGGRVAFEVMRLAPERVLALAVLDTGHQPLPEGEAAEREQAGRLALLHTAETRGMRAMATQWAPGMVHPDRHGTPLFEEVLRMLERKTPEIFAAQIRALLGRPDASDVLERIACPTWVVCGRQDTWSPPDRHEEICRHIAGAHLRLIEHCGHMSTMEQPARVTEVLDLCLDAAMAAGGGRSAKRM